MKIKCVRHPYTLYEAVIFYVAAVILVTLLSLTTGPILAFILQEGEQSIFIMRNINGAVTLWLMHRVLSKKSYSYCAILPASVLSAMLSACGYEIVGLLLVASATLLPIYKASSHQAQSESENSAAI